MYLCVQNVFNLTNMKFSFINHGSNNVIVGSNSLTFNNPSGLDLLPAVGQGIGNLTSCSAMLGLMLRYFGLT